MDEIARDFVVLGAVENVGVAVGISSIAHPISEMQSTSGLVSPCSYIVVGVVGRCLQWLW